MTAVRELVAQLEELGRISEEPGRLTRTFLSPAMVEAIKLAGCFMQDAGLKPRVDPFGNLVGRRRSRRRGARTLLLGSHLDTVRNAGKFDGALGVLLPISAMRELGRRGVQLPFHVEVLGFSEEEGVRFSGAYLGCSGYAGKLTPAMLELCDANGVTLAAALQEFGGNKFRRAKPAHRRRDLLGYVEVHIEQGPVLENEGLAVGVVSAIAGQSRFQLTWTGRAGHAGTTPMALRRDALAGAAEFALAVESLARRSRGLVATVGAFSVSPGVANVIPGEVVHSLDVRHARDATRRSALKRLGQLATQIARERGLKVRWRRTQDNAAVASSPALTARLNRSVRAVQGRSRSLVSGAGHDAVVMASLAPMAMLFVRCRGGISHHPDEHVSPSDLEVALQVVIDFLQRLAVEVET